VAWLVAELEAVAATGPVDLVGHDWGGGFVVRVVSTRPDLVRSWVSDAAGIGDVNFEWHDFAKIWQTPDEGEQFFEQQAAATPEERGAVFEMFGIPSERAVALASWADPVMAESILALYRSAVDVGTEWGPDFEAVPKPGLVIIPSDDPFLAADGARISAHRAGASIEELEGIGHWWMLQDPARGARVLESFWASVG
jgi:pimeloyl-ACP methyl ester carboxylesterase